MHLLIGIAGTVLIVVVLWDVFETIVLPRRVTRRVRLTRLFYRACWRPWSAICRIVSNRKRRETLLSIFGPLSILVLLTVWALALLLAFAMLHWAIGSRISSNGPTGFFADLYYSGTTFFTLGLGDVTPVGKAARAVTVLEASMGIGLLALVIGYLPVLYQAFSRREVNISLLDARAGTPPTAVELLRRHQEARSLESLHQLLRDWEGWAADLMESHLSYPVLCFFRSQHNNQSWLASLSTVLDTCSLVMVDIAQIFDTSPLKHDAQRLPDEDLARLRSILSDSGVMISSEPGDDGTLLDLGAMYEPYVEVLSRYLMMPLPGWLPKPRATDNWQTSAWENTAPATEQPFRKCMLATPAKTRLRSAPAPTTVQNPEQ